MTANGKLKVVVLGASGYTGAELLRLVAAHGGIEVVAVTAARRAGSPLGDVHPHLGGLMLPDLVTVDDVDWSTVDAVFSCLPHGTAQATIASLPGHLKLLTSLPITGSAIRPSMPNGTARNTWPPCCSVMPSTD